VEKGRSNPVLAATVQRSAEVYDQIPLREFIDEQQRSQLARNLYLEVSRICNTSDPATVCREQFVATMLRLALFQVLVIPPEPEEDRFGLRAQPGITGKLRAHLVRLCDIDDELRSAMYDETESGQYDKLWDAVQQKYWETYWLLETLNAARVEMGDFVDDDDWDKAFLHAACVNAEHGFRWKLEMPSAFPEDVASEATTAYSVFTDIVVSGARDPAAEWRDYYRASQIPMPNFGR